MNGFKIFFLSLGCLFLWTIHSRVYFYRVWQFALLRFGEMVCDFIRIPKMLDKKKVLNQMDYDISEWTGCWDVVISRFQTTQNYVCKCRA